MPLILITGYPSSGKTYRARQVLDYFDTRISQESTSSSSTARRLRTHLITDETLDISRSVYDLSSRTQHERSNNASEKDARAAIYGAVKRVLSDGDVVILDAAGGNYIKGWRYQLYCEAKAVRTASCVVHVGTPVERARMVNEERLRRREERSAEPKDGDVSGKNMAEQTGPRTEEAYERETWENLVFRYEEPNGMTRWDSPLFTVPWDDAKPPCVAIWEAVVGSADGEKVLVRPNQATVMKPSSGEGYLYNLDRATQDVLGKIAQWNKDHAGEGGGLVPIPIKGKEALTLNVELPANPIGLPALQRLRRQFISLNRQNAVSATRIAESFVAYLNDSFEAL
ncbi:MAG: hypothetical protein M1818_004146 [Claussenomyces sp. TS43310]|nr:MAG: hypothetical protein M1818_004146 [Claussenomyces sp. TS43310]